MELGSDPNLSTKYVLGLYEAAGASWSRMVVISG